MSTEGFSSDQISHYQAITLKHFLKGQTFNSGIQEKPLVAKMEAKAKTFRGGLDKISVPVRFETGAGGANDGLTGFSHTDTVNFYNPGNALRAEFVWREHHIGMTLSESEMKQQGILVQDSPRKINKGGDRGLEVLSNLLDEANADFAEQYADTLNDLLWGDGSADASGLHGIRAAIVDIPTLGTFGGLSRETYPRWRNIAFTAAFEADGSFDANHGGGAITSSPANGGALLQALTKMKRQLRRYGAKPDCFMAGSDFIDAMETEIRANGNYSDAGFTGKQDGDMGEMYFKGFGMVKYDPTLDDLDRSKFAYIWDSNDITLRTLEGDWKRQRTPERPYDQFVFHQSVLATGQLTSRRLNGAAVVEID